ncbi:hypothetical protein GN244_ATG18717 [Phytophthora infestans]|uniref:Uncharacterized protein n=1 Tax=Phytophthora infestans TaxID=4787 RepID=A0A833SQM6_PHYIN|nr:hypothetical protein GN244_ATG18717 [Phytophthora infestans]
MEGIPAFKHRQFTKKKNSPSRGNGVKQNEGGESRDIVDDAVVFEFNQFVCHGSAQLPTTMLKDSVSRGFPILRAQPTELAFGGVYDEILAPGGEHEAEFSRTKKWVQNLMREVSTASEGNEHIAAHLARWLEIEDGSEAFFELELARGSLCPFAQVVGEGQALDLMVWKGIVHDALLGVIYRRGSFFMTLKLVLESSDLDDDGPDQLFAGVPTRLKSKPVRAKRPANEDDAKSDFKASTKAQAKPIIARPAEFPDDKAASIAVPKADKVARPHHVSRLSGSEALLALQAKARASAQHVPWNLLLVHTGRPL